MKTRKGINYIICFIGLASFLSACGGGGSDKGDQTRNLSGSWSGAVAVVSDTCSPSSISSLAFRHTVNQNEEAIELIDQDSVRYIGNVISNSGFSVDNSRSIDNQSCTQATRIEYEDIADDDDPAAEVDIRYTVTCTNGSQCEVAYSGTASRAGVAPQPTPSSGGNGTPSATRTPTGNSSGGCAAMNPNPASGDYKGDGGCGISSVVYRFDQASGLLVLEPFGANGATSFAVNSSAVNSAVSSRNDLTIKGESGYACSIACSPPGTFTTSCFKEGGTTCVEKF